MNADQFRATLAGYLDSANTLCGEVEKAVAVGAATKDVHGRPKIAAPPAFTTQLAEARRILRQLADWSLDPFNSELDRG